MNVDATHDELAAIAEVLKLAAILDDRAPKADKSRIVAWAEQIHRHQLGREDLLDGLQAFYDQPQERAIAIGDLIQQAKRIRRDRLEREEGAARERHEAIADSKAADDMSRFSAAALSGPVENRTPRLRAATEALQECDGKAECIPAIREYLAALAEAKRKGLKRRPAA